MFGVFGKKKLKSKLSKTEIYEMIIQIENQIQFVKSTLYDNPFFQIAPTTLLERNEWVEMLTNFDIPKDTILKLFKIGYVIIDRELLNQKALIDFLEPLKISGQYLLLDSNYGLINLPTNPYKKNFYLGLQELKRYGETNPALQNNISNILSIGALRGCAILESNLMYHPQEIKIKTRAELNELINKLENNIKKNNSHFQIWYRGQSSEHFLNEVENELLQYCPWRNINDPSLVPSLYRKSEEIYDNLALYANKTLEILEFESALNQHLKTPLYNIRENDEHKVKEYFKGTIWEDSNSPFYTTNVNEKGETIEIHDYNPIYRALQTSLFLQHYGIPTGILDITKDADVALFFAQTKNNKGVYSKIDSHDKSVIYIFLLDPRTDRFIDSSEILEEFGVERPIRQKCGVLAGASLDNQNYYSRFISIRIKFDIEIEYDENYNGTTLFPNKNEDNVLDFLLNYGENNDTSLKAF